MEPFTKKKIQPMNRVSERLKQARKDAGISLYTIAGRTKLDRRYIEAIEDGQFDELPDAKVYRKNFIKRYLRAIGVDPKPYIAQFLTEEHSGEESIGFPTKVISQVRFSNLPFVMKYLGVTLVVAMFLSYLGFQVQNILEPPTLAIQSPRNGFVTAEGNITVKGKTNPEVRVQVNGKEITSNHVGEFEQNIDLSPGINELSISAIKKHGKTTTETRYVILKDGRAVSISESKRLGVHTR
ncbi:MAG: helix-turn-helix domain-containing protein [Candidatus Magasanikbacteria bacterium]